MSLFRRGEPAPPTQPAPAALRAVVVPVDGTSASTRAVPIAKQLAGALDAELVIVSVIDSFRAEAVARVARLRQVLADIPSSVERRVVQAKFVARAVAEESAGAIVCIATDANPFDSEGFRLSVTDQLVAAATSPVIVVGPECDLNPQINRIVVGIDPDHEQEGLVFWATKLAYELALPVEFVHVADHPGGDGAAKVRHVVPHRGQTVAECLLEESKHAILAMGSHGLTGFTRLAEGSVGGTVIPVSRQPILLLGPNTERPQ